MTNPIRQIIACELCGGMRVEWESWVDANRSVPTDSCGDLNWCPRCGDHVGVLFITGHDGAWSLDLSPRGPTYPSLRAALRGERTMKNRRKEVLHG